MKKLREIEKKFGLTFVRTETSESPKLLKTRIVFDLVVINS